MTVYDSTQDLYRRESPYLFGKRVLWGVGQTREPNVQAAFIESASHSLSHISFQQNQLENR